MSGLISFVYGLAAYAAGVAALVYFIAFGANLGVPKSVDVGGSAAWPQALLVDLLLLTLFGLQHSVMARRGFKRWWTRFVPAPAERSTYLLATALALAVVFHLWAPVPAPVIWQLEAGAGASALWSLFGLGWVLVLVSTFLINHFELFGLRQVYLRLRERGAASAEFRTPLLYRHVRHPLYLGLLTSLWAVPSMSAGRALLALGLTAYILVGVFFEERDLVRQFGERYRHYQARVGMLIPWP